MVGDHVRITIGKTISKRLLRKSCPVVYWEDDTSHNLFDRINSRTAAEGDPAEPKSELKYLRLILDIKEQQPILFRQILALPRKARSSRCHAPEPASATDPDTVPLLDRPAVISYFRQGRLDKFFRAHGGNNIADELDFFTTAEILETTDQELCQPIPPELFYSLLIKNKSGFQSVTTPGVESLLSPVAATGHAAILLKRLRAKDFRNARLLKPEDRKLAVEVQRLIAEGRIGKNTLRKVKEAFDQTVDPVAMIAILRQEIPGEYLRGATPPTDQNAVTAPREVILSAYLLKIDG